MNYKDTNIVGIAGDTVWMKVIERTTSISPDSISCWEVRRVLRDSSCIQTNHYKRDTTLYYNVDSIFIILTDTLWANAAAPDSGGVDSIGFYNSVYYEIEVEHYYEFTPGSYSYNNNTAGIKTKFLQPNPTVAGGGSSTFLKSSAKADTLNLYLSDFIILRDLSGITDTVTIDSVRWFFNDSCIKLGTLIDTVHTIQKADTGDYWVVLECRFVTASSYGTKTFIRNINSDTLSVDSTMFTNITTAIKDNIFSENSLRIYPNPVTDMLYFSQTTQYAVFSINGQEIVRGVGDRVRVSEFKPGVYILHTAEKSISFVVEKMIV